MSETNENNTTQNQSAPQKVFSVDDMIAAAGHSSDENAVVFTAVYKHITTKEEIGYFDFKALSAPTYRKFQDIHNGTFKKKADRSQAIKFIFEKCCIAFRLVDSSAQLNTGKHPSWKVMFMNEAKLEMVIDEAVNDYLGEVKPDVSDIKK